MSDRIAYVLSTCPNLGPIRMFLDRYADDRFFDPQEYVEWEKGAYATAAVQAILDPRGDNLLVGLLLFAVERRHLNLLYACVATDYRRRGVASGLFYRMATDPWSRHYRTISARVSDECLAGHLWLKHLRFKAISVLPGQAGDRDHYLFTWDHSRLGKEQQNAKAGTLVCSDSDAAIGAGGRIHTDPPDEPPGPITVSP